MKKNKYDHITPVLNDLHWLPINSRILFKICLLVHKSLNESAPLYLQDLVTPYEPRRPELRSVDKRLLNQCAAKYKCVRERSFVYAAAKLWNNLPTELKMCSSFGSFKWLLKTDLFKDYFKDYL